MVGNLVAVSAVRCHAEQCDLCGKEDLLCALSLDPPTILFGIRGLACKDAL